MNELMKDKELMRERDKEVKKGYRRLQKDLAAWAVEELEDIKKEVKEVEECLKTKRYEGYYEAVDAIIKSESDMTRALERIAAREKEARWLTERAEALEYKRCVEVEELVSYIETNRRYLKDCADEFDILTYYSYKEKGIIIE